MTKLQLIELCCPVCDNHFRSRAVEVAGSPAGEQTDFHEQSPGKAPLRYLVHMCDRCGFSGAERDFTQETELSAVVIDHVWNELAPFVADHSAASEKFEAAAKVAEWRGGDSRHAADLWLRAAWCCVDEGDVEAERFSDGRPRGGSKRLRGNSVTLLAIGLDDLSKSRERNVTVLATQSQWTDL